MSIVVIGFWRSNYLSSIKFKAIQGSVWVGISTISNQALNFLTTLLLAKLLLPADFGLIAIANLTVNTLSLFRNFGLSDAVIYHQGERNRLASTAFLLITTFGVIQYLVAYITAPFIALFFGNDEVINLIRFMALSLPISSVGLVPFTLLDKELDFRLGTVPKIVPTFVYTVTVIILVLAGVGVWSIAIGSVIQAIVFVIISWVVSDWRLTFNFDRKIGYEMLLYGKDLVGTSILAFCFVNIDNIFIGRILNTENLGFYTFAFSLINVPTMQIPALINTVLFPAYVKIGNNLESMQKAYLRITKIISSTTIPISLGLAAIAQPFVITIYGEKWKQSIILIQILSVYALARSISAIFGIIVRAIGKQHIMPRMTFGYVATAALLLAPSIYWGGTIGVSILMSTILLIGMFGWMLIINHYLSISTINFLKVIIPSLISGLFMFAVVWICSQFITSSIVGVFVLVVVGCLTYILILLKLTQGDIYLEFLDIVRHSRPLPGEVSHGK